MMKDRRVKVPRELVCWAAIAVLTAGCQNGPKLVEVEGVVTLDGAPLQGATVTFQPIEGRPSVGTTDVEGRYALTYTPERRGALAGEHAVSIATVMSASDEPPRRFVKDRVPPRYNSASTLRVVVEPGRKTHDFTLDTK